MKKRDREKVERKTQVTNDWAQVISSLRFHVCYSMPLALLCTQSTISNTNTGTGWQKKKKETEKKHSSVIMLSIGMCRMVDLFSRITFCWTLTSQWGLEQTDIIVVAITRDCRNSFIHNKLPGGARPSFTSLRHALSLSFQTAARPAGFHSTRQSIRGARSACASV